MPVTIKRGMMKYKNSTTGEYVGVDVAAERTTAEQIAAIEHKGQEVLESIPNDYAELNDRLAQNAGMIALVESRKISKPAANPDGEAGQILRTNGDGTVAWDNAATSEEIASATTAWLDEHVSGGQTIVVDDSLSVAGAAADAKKTGDNIHELGQATQITAKSVDVNEDADLDFTDDAGNVLARFSHGEIITKYFQSNETLKVKHESANVSDLDFTDIGGNVVLRVADGHIYTSNFDSAYSERVLPSTGDETDRTADILQELKQYGICRLGSGVYYTTGINMPNGSALIGCGAASKLYLIADIDGYAIKMNDDNTISKLSIIGAESNIELSDVVGTRHGIYWAGNYNQSRSTEGQPRRGILSDLYISQFTGGGVTCHDTGYGTGNCMYANNILIHHCNAGINIDYWSEFHKFTNVKAIMCYYGCINNGGNNVFTACDFSDTKLGFLMDNTDGKSPNNSHGSAIGCVFNHMNNNTGASIKIINCGSGYIFDGCQIFYGQTEIEDSNGIVFSACNYGKANCDITITGGGTVLYANCIYQEAPVITITNNEHVHFTGCYTRSTGEPVTA